MLAVIAAPIPKPIIQQPCVQISQDWGEPKEPSEDSIKSEELSPDPTPSPPPKEESEPEEEEVKAPTPEPVKEEPPIEVIEEQPSI